MTGELPNRTGEPRCTTPRLRLALGALAFENARGRGRPARADPPACEHWGPRGTGFPRRAGRPGRSPRSGVPEAAASGRGRVGPARAAGAPPARSEPRWPPAGSWKADDRGARAAREAVGLLERSPPRLEHAKALTTSGSRCGAPGTEGRAGAAAGGIEVARRCGAVPVARRAHRSCRRPARRSALRAIGVESLTPSERRIAEIAAKGLTNRQIAQDALCHGKDRRDPPPRGLRQARHRSRRELPDALGPEQRDEPADR